MYLFIHSVTESEIEPLKSHLTDMETDVNEMVSCKVSLPCVVIVDCSLLGQGFVDRDYVYQSAPVTRSLIQIYI